MLDEPFQRYLQSKLKVTFTRKSVLKFSDQEITAHMHRFRKLRQGCPAIGKSWPNSRIKPPGCTEVHSSLLLFSSVGHLQCSTGALMCKLKFRLYCTADSPSLYMGGSRGGDRGPDPPEKSQKYRVSKQYWSGSPKMTKLQSQHSIGPSSARQQKAI